MGPLSETRGGGGAAMPRRYSWPSQPSQANHTLLPEASSAAAAGGKNDESELGLATAEKLGAGPGT